MSLTTFLLVVLAVWVGNNLNITIGRAGWLKSVKLCCTVFGTGFMIVDSTVKDTVRTPITLDSTDYEEFDQTQTIINKVKDRGEWHLHIGKYYAFYITPSKG